MRNNQFESPKRCRMANRIVLTRDGLSYLHSQKKPTLLLDYHCVENKLSSVTTRRNRLHGTGSFLSFVVKAKELSNYDNSGNSTSTPLKDQRISLKELAGKLVIRNSISNGQTPKVSAQRKSFFIRANTKNYETTIESPNSLQFKQKKLLKLSEERYSRIKSKVEKKALMNLKKKLIWPEREKLLLELDSNRRKLSNLANQRVQDRISRKRTFFY